MNGSRTNGGPAGAGSGPLGGRWGAVHPFRMTRIGRWHGTVSPRPASSVVPGGEDMAGTHRGEPDVGGSRYADDEVTGWVAWVMFAGIMMVMIGVFHAIAGL